MAMVDTYFDWERLERAERRRRREEERERRWAERVVRRNLRATEAQRQREREERERQEREAPARVRSASPARVLPLQWLLPLLPRHRPPSR